jgi:hypothetical protein
MVAEGVIWGLGGCKIASWYAPHGERNVSSRPAVQVLAVCRLPLTLIHPGPKHLVLDGQVADGVLFGGAERLDLLVWMVAAQFGVGDDG